MNTDNLDRAAAIRAEIQNLSRAREQLQRPEEESGADFVPSAVRVANVQAFGPVRVYHPQPEWDAYIKRASELMQARIDELLAEAATL